MAGARLAPQAGLNPVDSETILAIDALLRERIEAGFSTVFAGQTHASATTGQATAPAPTAQEIIASIERCVLRLGKEPIAELMRSKGWPPERYTLVLPESLRPDPAPEFWPPYVRFNKLITQPVAVLSDTTWRSL